MHPRVDVAQEEPGRSPEQVGTFRKLAGLTVPTLALLAGRTIAHSPRTAMSTARTVPNVEAELWPQATHAINGEYPEEIAARVNRFVDSRARRG